MPPMDQPRFEEVVAYDTEGKIVCYHHKERVCGTCCVNYDFQDGFDFGGNVFDKYAVPVCLPHRRRICHECCTAFSCDTALGIKTPNSYSVDDFGKLICAWHGRRVCHICDIALIYGASETNSIGHNPNDSNAQLKHLERWMLPGRASSERSYATKASSFSTRDSLGTTRDSARESVRDSVPAKGSIETRETAPSRFPMPAHESAASSQYITEEDHAASKDVAFPIRILSRDRSSTKQPAPAQEYAAVRQPALEQHFVPVQEPDPETAPAPEIESAQTIELIDQDTSGDTPRPRVSLPSLTPATVTERLPLNNQDLGTEWYKDLQYSVPTNPLTCKALLSSSGSRSPLVNELHPSRRRAAPSVNSTPESTAIRPWRASTFLQNYNSDTDSAPELKEDTAQSFSRSEVPSYESWDAAQSTDEVPTPPMKWPSSNYCDQCELSWLCVRDTYVTEHPLHNSCEPVGSKSDFDMKARTLIVNFHGLMPQGESTKLGGAGVFFGPSSVYNRSEILSSWYTSTQSAGIEAARMAVQDVRQSIIPRRVEFIENQCRGEVECQLRDAKPFRLILVSDARNVVEMMSVDIMKWKFDPDEQVYINRKGTVIRNSFAISQLAREMELLTDEGIEIQWHHTKPEFNVEAWQLAKDAIDRDKSFGETGGDYTHVSQANKQSASSNWRVVTWSD
ncbi:hypothetical protein ACHAQA_006102 [Verticillium albo-atrum]